MPVPAAADTIPDTFPAQPPDLVRETVGASHGRFERVKELVSARPALAKAAVDWGFGDWEDALGAASHTGNREIAEYLIAHGARPTVFSAAMLGQLEVVKAFVAAQPGVQRIPGPHSISLLAHARAGKKLAEPVLDYLRSLGDAGSPERPALETGDAARLTGVYQFGAGPRDRFEVGEKDGRLSFTRPGAQSRFLTYLGDWTFHPAGAEAVRIRFVESGAETLLTIHDPDVVVTARKG
ncbi:MAG: hypothetical protein R2729_12325 [Bryobacteraceae bacterium]